MKFYKSLLVFFFIFTKVENVLSDENIFNVNNVDIVKKSNLSSEQLANQALKKGFRNPNERRNCLRGILEEMLRSSNERYDKTTRLELSYGILRRFGRAVPCVKRYLGDHVKSSTVRIDADEWEIAIFLPVERFQKESKKTVWADSRRYY